MNKLCTKCGHYAVRNYIVGDTIVSRCFWCLKEETVAVMFKKEDKKDAGREDTVLG